MYIPKLKIGDKFIYTYVFPFKEMDECLRSAFKHPLLYK